MTPDSSSVILRPAYTTRCGGNAVRLVVLVLLAAASAGCKDEPVASARTRVPPRSEGELVGALESAYRERDPAVFEPLFHPEFTYHEVDDDRVVWTCRERWLCQHRNLFDPQHAEPPIPHELQLVGLEFAAGPVTAFEEKPEYYASDVHPQGLDPQRWRVTAADVEFRIFVDLLGETDYEWRQRSNLVVLEDRAKASGETGKYTFLAIELVSVARKAEEPPTWGLFLELLGGLCDDCPLPTAVQAVVDTLERAYATLDRHAFARLLHPDFVFSPAPVPNRPWGRVYEERVHRRMFTPDDLAPGDVPVPADLRVQRIDIALAVQSATLSGETGSEPVGAGVTTTVMPRRLWSVRIQAHVFVDTQGATDYQIDTVQHLALAPLPETPRALCIYSWYESTLNKPEAPHGRTPDGVEAISWRALRRLYDGN